MISYRGEIITCGVLVTESDDTWLLSGGSTLQISVCGWSFNNAILIFGKVKKLNKDSGNFFSHAVGKKTHVFKLLTYPTVDRISEFMLRRGGGVNEREYNT